MTLYMPPRMGVRGLSQYNPVPTGCVLYAPLWSPYLKGTVFKSQDLYRHTCTVTGATWGSTGRVFDGNDYIEVNPTPTQLDFTTGDFSFAMWIKPTTIAGDDRSLIYRGSYQVDGWYCYLASTGAITFTTNQLAARQNSASSAGDFVINEWAFLTVTRIGSTCKIYKNVADITFTGPGAHTNPATSSRTVKIGIADDKASDPYIGIMGEHWVFNRAITTAEMTNILNVTKWRYS